MYLRFNLCVRDRRLLFRSPVYIEDSRKKYSSSYLKSLRYKNRSDDTYAYCYRYLMFLGIYKFFNSKRGSRSGKFLKACSNLGRIKLLTHNVRRDRVISLNYRPVCLKKIDLIKNHYCWPSMFITNLRSISNKFEQLIIANKVYDPDIMLLSETWISNQNSSAYEIDGYNAFHRIRDRCDKTHGGGITAYVKNNITIHHVLMSDIQNIEVMTLICKPKYLPRGIPWIGILLVYYPPNDGNEHEMIAYILKEYDRLMAINNKACIFIAGDLNSLDVNSIMRLPDFKQLVDFPTRGVRCLDLCFTNCSEWFVSQILPAVANSDHNLILITPKQQKKPVSAAVKVTYRKKISSGYRTMAYTLFNHDWYQWSLIESVQDMADIFYDFINTLYEISFPLVTEYKKTSSHPWMTGHIEALIRKRDSFSCIDNESYETKMISKQIKIEIRKAKAVMCDNLMNLYRSAPKHFYDLIKKATNSNVNTIKSSQITFPESNVEESRQIICNYFKDLLNSHPKRSSSDLFGSSDDFMIPQIDIFDVFYQLKKLPMKGSISPGEIPSHIYRELAEFLSEAITIMINRSLVQAICPTQWKCGYLITIPKIANVKSPNQLRPIVITSPLAKIAERHILSILKTQSFDKLDPMQFGGLKDRSTCQYISLYLHRAIMHLEAKSTSVTSIFADFTKAFDSVDHKILIHKMMNLSISPIIVKWIINFLSDRCTVLKSDKSENNLSFTSTNGVPQGSVLGGFLFILMVNDLMALYPSRLKYMDDLTVSLYGCNTSDNNIQKVMDDLNQQSNDLHIPLNIDKCVVMHHSFSKVLIEPSVMVSDVLLNKVSTFKLLGVVLQNNFKWGAHVEAIIGKANKKIHLIYMLRRLGADKCILLNTYTSFIRPILEYCAPVWHSGLTKSQCFAIEQIQKRITRIILWNDHMDYLNRLRILNIPSLEERRKVLHYNFACDFFKVFPTYLPKTKLQSSGRFTRSANLHVKPLTRTKRADQSPIVSFINVINHHL